MEIRQFYHTVGLEQLESFEGFPCFTSGVIVTVFGLLKKENRFVWPLPATAGFGGI